ncbi:MFS transporter [Arthrobacter ginkgonis]|uniref:Multidrug efflux pump Tap n=1 Tax=Arthrobacter ginkgonis TaxID=1630594 RepID=A0ABP7CHG0_9MICC
MIRWLRRHALDLSPLRTSRPFALLFWARTVSIAGIGVMAVALPLQVYGLTGDSLQVAMVNTVLGIAGLGGALAGGLVADRRDRRRVILAARAAAVLGFAILAANAFMPEPALWVFYLCAVIDGVAGGVSTTALSAAVPSTVQEHQLPATAALMAISLDLGMVFSPALGGLLYAAVGPGWLYVWVVVACLASLALLWRLPALEPGVEENDGGGNREAAPAGLLAGLAGAARTAWTDTREGLVFVVRHRAVGAVMLLGFIQLLCASPHVLIPEFAERQLGIGPEATGLLYSAPAVGALAATVASGWTGRVRRVGRVLTVILVVASLGVLMLGISGSMALAVAAMALTGVGDVLAEIFRYSIIARETPDRLLGRVGAVWSAQGTVGDTLGGPLLSLLARLAGPGGAIALGGAAAAVLTVAVYATTPELRRLEGAADTMEHDAPGHDDVEHGDTGHTENGSNEAARDNAGDAAASATLARTTTTTQEA